MNRKLSILLTISVLLLIMVGCTPIPKEPAELKVYPLKLCIIDTSIPHTLQVFGYDIDGNQIDLVNEDISWEVVFPTNFEDYGELIQEDSRVAVVFNQSSPSGTFRLRATYHNKTVDRKFQKTICCSQCWDPDAYTDTEFIPEPIIIEPDPTLVICGGTYRGYYSEWNFCGCDNKPKYPRGAYYFNPDGEYMFLVGEPVTMPFITYGKCPSEYIEVYEIPEEYR